MLTQRCKSNEPSLRLQPLIKIRFPCNDWSIGIEIVGRCCHRLERLVDRDGQEKTTLQMIVEEVESAGIEEIAVIIQPGDAEAYKRAAGQHLGLLQFIEQPSPLGYGDALLRAKSFVGDQPFLHLVGDHLYLSHGKDRCAKQLIDVATEFECSVSAVQATRENRLPLFGAVSGSNLPRREGAMLVVVTHSDWFARQAAKQMRLEDHCLVTN